MVRPFSRLGVRGANALAGTVAGIVRNQNATAPTTAATTAPMSSRFIKDFSRERDFAFYTSRGTDAMVVVEIPARITNDIRC
jgi:hypothetical protein